MHNGSQCTPNCTQRYSETRLMRALTSRMFLYRRVCPSLCLQSLYCTISALPGGLRYNQLEMSIIKSGMHTITHNHTQ